MAERSLNISSLFSPYNPICDLFAEIMATYPFNASVELNDSKSALLSGL